MARTRNERKKYDDERKAFLSVLALIALAAFFVLSAVNALALAMY